MQGRIGILTSGGDCAGLNAAIRAATHRAHALGFEMIGIANGTAGLFERPALVRRLTPADCDPSLLRQGGTILGTTNKGNPFAFPMPDGTKKDRSGEIIAAIRGLGITGLIGIGGDGSLAILRRLAQQGGFGLVGIPKTIDNDVGATESCIGFETAVSVAMEALDRLQPTAASHARVMILEVMGRDAGHIALAAGIAGGADVILLPEIPYDIAKVCAHVETVRESGRNFALVIVSEAVRMEGGSASVVQYSHGQERFGGIGAHIAGEIARETGAETRVTVLGHVQRGGSPVAQDRIMASAFGVHAVDLIARGETDRMVAWMNRDVTSVPLAQGIETYRTVDVHGALVRTARALGVCLGD
jgi:6-phosphofructokinase 1